MGELLKFPKGEPEGEAPKTGYCTSCGVAVAWPDNNTEDPRVWPEACPNGCTPFLVQSWPIHPHKRRAIVHRGPAPCE